MKGRLRPASAVYPLHRASGFDLNFFKVTMVALVGEVLETICAFCFITSAGVRMAQETSSAREEAVE